MEWRQGAYTQARMARTRWLVLAHIEPEQRELCLLAPHPAIACRGFLGDPRHFAKALHRRRSISSLSLGQPESASERNRERHVAGDIPSETIEAPISRTGRSC